LSRFLDLKFIGERRLQKKFKKLPRNVQNQIFKVSAKKALEPVRDLAIQRAPLRTGRTRRHIKIGVHRSNRGFTVGGEVRTGTRKQMGIAATSKFYYPAAFEYGTNKMAARSFLRSAMADRRRVVIRILTAELRALLKKA